MLGMSWRNLYRQPLRTFLTALGISIGVAAIVAFGSIVRGFWASTNAAIHFSEGDMMVFQAGVAADLFSSLDEAKTRTALLADPDVLEAVPVLMHVMPAPRLRFGFTIGMRPEDMRARGRHLIRGRYPEADDELLLGSVAARLAKLDVGGRTYLARHHFRVVGIFETEVVYFNSAMVVPLTGLQKILNRPGQVSSFQVQVRPGVSPALVGQRIERNHPNLFTVTGAEQYNKVDQGLEMANTMVGAVSLLAFIIGSVIIANTMWMTVHERTREIGVLRAVGWDRRRIVGVIISEAAGVGLLACILGCLLGVGLALLSTKVSVTAQFVDPVFDWQPFSIALGTAVVLSIAGGALPAWRAAGISPVEALRHE